MKKITLQLIISLAFLQMASAQDLASPKTRKILAANSRPHNIVFGGIDNINVALSQTPGIFYEPRLYAMSLWLGGLDSLGKVVTAVKPFYKSSYDFYAGPNLPISEDSLLKNSRDYDKIWKMTAVEINTFRNDVKDGVLNGAFSSIMAWPAKNNPHSMEYNGFELPQNIDLAAFKDVNNDGIYDPLKGDFPMLEGIAENDLPAVFYWCIYHDRGTHFSNNGKSMNVEIQQSAWQYDCKNDTILDNTLFFSYKITNKGTKTIDSLFAGIITDIDNCFNNSMIGCVPNQNTFWAYENLAYKQPCNTSPNQFIAPAVSFTFLNQPMHSFIAIKGSNSFDQYPITNNQLYNVLNGKWSDGKAMFCCGKGNQTDSTQQPTRFLFPDNPNKMGGWSMQQNQNTIPSIEREGIGSISLKNLLPNQSQRIDIALSYHQDTSHRQVLQATDLMYRNISILQNAYNQHFTNKCVTKVSSSEPAFLEGVSIFPNPFENSLIIENHNTQYIDYQIYSTQGIVLQKGKIAAENSQTLGTGFLPKGIYFVQLKGENGVMKVAKLVK